MIFQDFNLFDHLNALQNVRIGMVKVKGMGGKEAGERAVAELERVGLKDHMQKYPAQLSGEQKQRVSIARALAMDPKVMLLDEPTSALDPELIGEVHSVIRDLGRNGMTMIMATHQIGFASSLASEIIFMEDGRILEKGRPTRSSTRPNAPAQESSAPRSRSFTGRRADDGGVALHPDRGRSRFTERILGQSTVDRPFRDLRPRYWDHGSACSACTGAGPSWPRPISS